MDLPCGAIGVRMKFRQSEDGRSYRRRVTGMRGRYLVRSNKAVVALSLVDSLLSIVPRGTVAVPDNISSIVVANGAHLGDVLLTLPAVAVLRQAFPVAKIDAIVGSWARSVAEWSGLFDDVHVFDHWKHSRSSSKRFIRYREARSSILRILRTKTYQIGIDFYPFFPPTHPLFFQAGIPVRIGFESGGFGALLTHRVAWRNADISFTEHLQDLLLQVDRSIMDNSVLEFRAINASRDPPAPLERGNYIVLHPGAGAPYKEWSIDNWRSLAGRLRARGERVVVTGAGNRERELSANLKNVIDFNFVDTLSWCRFADVVAGAKAVICPDTVTGHLAAIFKVPTVVIFTGTNNVRHWAPRSSFATTVMNAVYCAPCYRNGCKDMRCIQGVTVATVLSALEGVLRNFNDLKTVRTS